MGGDSNVLRDRNRLGMALVTSEMEHLGPFGSQVSFWAWEFLSPDGGKILRKFLDLGPCSWAAAVGLESEPTTSGTHLLWLLHFSQPRQGGPAISHLRVAGNTEEAGKRLL